MNQDIEHLHLLSIFHYVVGGLAGLFALIPVMHLVFGLAMASGALDSTDDVARAIGCFFVVFASLGILLGLGFAACLILAGRSLARRERYTFCLVMAALACMFVPFGTVLGIFTILVLMRDSVKELFGRAPARLSPPGEGATGA